MIEWAIESALRTERVDPLEEYSSTFAQAVTATWSPNEAERLEKLASKFPELMTYEESRLWRVLIETTELLDAFSKRKQLDMLLVNREWEKLKPLLLEAADQPVLIGLTRDQLIEAVVDIVPF